MMPVLLRIIAITVLSVISIASGAIGATQQQIDTVRAKGLAYLMSHQNGDGSWQAAPGLEVQSTATALTALTNAGINRGYSFGSAVSWLKNNDALSVDSLSRKAIALKGAGADVKTDLEQLLTRKNISDRATWGAYNGYGTSFPDTPLAIAAIRIGQYGYTSQTTELRNSVYCEILPAQRPDYSWSFVKPVSNAPGSVTSGAIIPTAITVAELNEIAKSNSSWDSNTCGSTYSLKNAVTNGITWLLGKKNADGGFGDNGLSSPLETALVYQTLNAVNSVDPAKDAARDYLINHQGADGGWQGDPFQTALALQTLPATSLLDSDNDGIPDVVEAILGTNPYVADSRGFVKGNGEGVTGITSPILLATATQYSPFSTTLPPKGGTSPYCWKIISGSLPDGIVLSATTGTVSGTPLIAGAFNFIYQVKDANGLATEAVGKIVIEPLYPPAAAFRATPTTVSGPFTVNFTDQSQRAISWQWDFGDGATSTEQNPSHTYQARSNYTVSLTATNQSGNNTVSKRIVDFIDMTPIIMMLLED